MEYKEKREENSLDLKLVCLAMALQIVIRILSCKVIRYQNISVCRKSFQCCKTQDRSRFSTKEKPFSSMNVLN